ncbi:MULTISPECIES: SPFH domain-containing protein [Chryseobacterium]|uniref:SPFH domain / Band 7 family protein n=2 Tax=Chryseobacterium TaxID=59732 RepID=A0A1N7MA94_9FLAO|nr:MULTISPECIES: SPFH domain-containing protein [Chryseobacterium]HAO08097.1 membrane protease subunit, stomatin/prohibitin [Chryseobacterium sp.]MCF2220827.1 membrane protease subunit, stomatin/prohibitin [Chryseobacterium sp. PS-8]PTT75006.1 membrane protease subunit, stomatin/prohibitin [Chryseobacterium sp. HMWF001]PVV61704.1 membrane protease subunit, stomatin/prohibitin [Chryseobacterium sp. HMWF035]SIS82987.1 SPFH domain / Band 7 family protein [Chryseobacterium gambrini]
MFGFTHIKFDSMTYVLHFKNGKIAREGRGLSFFYFAPNSSIVAIPLGSNDLPFIFNENTNDYQTVKIQGQISYKVTDPKALSNTLDFTVDGEGVYKKNDIEKLNQRIINLAQTATSSFIHQLNLKDAIRSAKQIEDHILKGLIDSESIKSMGIEILGANILAVQTTPEMARALETETREKLQQQADEAIYERRNFAVEQERKIKESELNTEIAVEEKQKQIEEKRMETEVQQEENNRILREMKIAADISVENQRKKLIEQKTENDRKEAETQGYILETSLKPYKEIDWKVLTALSGRQDARNNIALAFRELAENAGKIGNLNISPDLLDSILKK